MTEGSDSPPRLAVALPAVIAGGALGAATLQPLWNADTFGHLAQGRAIVEAGGVPRHDPFSFWRDTPQPWVNYEWLSDLVTWLVYDGLGPNGVIALAVLLAAGAAAGLVALAGRLGSIDAAWLTSLLLVVTVPAVRFRLSARPHLLALPFAVVYLALLTREDAFRDRRRALVTVATLGGLHLAWANLHGSHLLGLGVVFASALAAWPDRRRAGLLLGVTGLLVAVSCLTPYGPAATVDAIAHVFDPAYRAAVTEWASLFSLGVRWPTVHAVAVGVLLLAVAPGLLRAGGPRRTALLVAASLALLSLRSLRFVLVAFFFGAAAIALGVAGRLDLRRLRRPAVLAPAFAAALAVAVLGARVEDPHGFQPLRGGVDHRLVPAEAAAHIDEALGEARVIASVPSSWYLLFAAPRAKVLTDGRVPFYGPAHIAAVQAALERPGRLVPLLATSGADTLLLQHTSPTETPALAAIRREPSFVPTWIDAEYVVFVARRLVEARGIDPGRLDALPTGYEPTAILGADAAGARAIREDLGHLGGGVLARAYGAFVRAMLRLRPLAREGGWAGYRAPADEAERRAVATAREELARVQPVVGDLPVLDAQLALVAALACDLDAARAHLARASAEEEVRETLFGRAEIDLRAGDPSAVDAFLAQARATPGGAGDAWVAALAEERAAGLRCPDRGPLR